MPSDRPERLQGLRAKVFALAPRCSPLGYPATSEPELDQPSHLDITASFSRRLNGDLGSLRHLPLR